MIWLVFIGWVLYGVVHSFLAAPGVKKRIMELTGLSPKYYRLIYSGIAILGILGMGWIVFLASTEKLFFAGRILRLASLLIATLGIQLIILAFRKYSFSAFIGLREETEEELLTDGILAHIRHPIYSGTILLVLGFFLWMPTLPILVSGIIIFIYLGIGIYLEESKLIKRFGDSYRDYQKKVGALFPNRK